MTQPEDTLLGYVVLYRCLLKKPIWQLSTPEQKVILVTLLLMVNHEENEWEWQGEKFKVQPGQMITSANSIIKAAGKDISRQNVRTALERFRKLEFLTYESTKTGMLITILNWHTYQIELRKSNQQTNQGVTKGSPRGNQGVTTNNNDNNDKNDNKVSRSVSNIFTPPTLDEVRAYCQERNRGVDPERWFNFYQAKGWMVGKNKMKDWKAAVRTWEQNNGGNNGTRPNTSTNNQQSGESKKYNSRPLD